MSRMEIKAGFLEEAKFERRQENGWETGKLRGKQGEEQSWQREEHVQRSCGRKEQSSFKEMKALWPEGRQGERERGEMRLDPGGPSGPGDFS